MQFDYMDGDPRDYNWGDVKAIQFGYNSGGGSVSKFFDRTFNELYVLATLRPRRLDINESFRLNFENFTSDRTTKNCEFAICNRSYRAPKDTKDTLFPSEKNYMQDGWQTVLYHVKIVDGKATIDYRNSESARTFPLTLTLDNVLPVNSIQFFGCGETLVRDIVISDKPLYITDKLQDITVLSTEGWTKEADGSYTVKKKDVPLTVTLDREQINELQNNNEILGCGIVATTTTRGDDIKKMDCVFGEHETHTQDLSGEQVLTFVEEETKLDETITLTAR